MKTLGFKVDDQTYALLEAQAASTGRSLSEVARAALSAGLMADATPAAGVGELGQVLKILERIQALCMFTAAANSKAKDKGVRYAMKELARDLPAQAMQIARLIDDAPNESEERW